MTMMDKKRQSRGRDASKMTDLHVRAICSPMDAECTSRLDIVPDIRGYSIKKVNAIVTYNGPNHLIKKDVPCDTDLTCIMTYPDNIGGLKTGLTEPVPDPEDKEPFLVYDIRKERPDPDAKKKTKNPNYKGMWKAPMTDQVNRGTLFDNVLIYDDPEYAKTVAEETWGKNKDGCGFALFDFYLWKQYEYGLFLVFNFPLQAENKREEEAT
ncbi:calreticulin-like [Rhodamnia argentea]|uniref:Calreticulin-like n=1 Tax=Rhodamnia argentea TaxID=178133 RepID=A0A8B8QCN1_9MYRT|nr:calreticulin-like [Rhodamnia argentea]